MQHALEMISIQCVYVKAGLNISRLHQPEQNNNQGQNKLGQPLYVPKTMLPCKWYGVPHHAFPCIHLKTTKNKVKHTISTQHCI